MSFFSSVIQSPSTGSGQAQVKDLLKKVKGISYDNDKKEYIFNVPFLSVKKGTKKLSTNR